MNTDTGALPIECKRLRLRRFTPLDLDPFVAYRRDEEVQRYQGWPRPYTAELGRALIEQMQHGPLLHPGAWAQIAIAERETDTLIGDIGTYRSADTPGEYTLGFTIAPAQQRRGLASEALRAWLRALQEQGEATRVLAISDARNLASQRLLARLGFVFDHAEPAEYFGESCVDRHYVLVGPGKQG